MDAITIAATIAAAAGAALLVAPLWSLVSRRKAKGNLDTIMISVTKNDGSTSSIKLDQVQSSISEADLKRVIDLLQEADDAKSKVSPEK